MPIGIILFLLFLILKLTGVIALAWLWVTAPLWIPLAIGVIFGVIAAVVGGSTVRVRRHF